MKTLFYVPIIHTSADFGSLAEDLTKRGIAGLGEEVWREHIKIVNDFWDTISHYFDSIDVSEMKLYQDGMVAEGEVGEKIVQEGVKSGSKNHTLVLNLLQRGAILVKTENFVFVKTERDRLVTITQSKTVVKKLWGFMKYKLTKNKLLNKRDEFIAQRVRETLNHNEKGVLFIGAFHNIKEKLSNHIQIQEIKDVEKVREYQRLLPFYGKNKKRIAELRRYLISKVEI